MRKRHLSLIAILLFGTLLPFAAQAQEQPPDPEIEVLHTIATDVGDAIELEVFFAMRDKRTGEAVRRDVVNFDSAATVQIVGTEVVTGTLDDEPQTPIKVVLVIDKSRSMSRVIGEENDKPVRVIDAVRTAAQEALAAAPPNASFAVISFARESTIESDGFLRNADQSAVLRADIAKFEPVAERPGNTCIADAADDAITYLSQQTTAEERKAIILFTDGKDREGNSNTNLANNCSNLTIDQVQDKALLTQSSVIPIYVVAPCIDDCTNIKADELVALAQGTRAFQVIEPISEMRASFTKIMETLNGQQSVRARVFPREGENTATFVLNRPEASSLSGTVQFRSPKDFVPPPRLTLEPLGYNDITDSYTATVSIVNPRNVELVSVGVFTSAEGDQVVIPAQEERVDGRGEVPFIIPARGLKADLPYFFLLRARSQDGPLLTDKGSAVLGLRSTTYKPNLRFEIISLVPNYKENLLKVDLRFTGGQGGRDLRLRGTLTQDATGDANAINPTAPQGDTLTLPLPPLLSVARTKQFYTLNLILQLDGKDFQDVSKKQELDPPPPPMGTPWGLIIAGLLVALAGAVGTAFLVRSHNAARQAEIPIPFNDATVLHHEPKPSLSSDATVLHVPDEARQSRLRIRITQAGSTGLPREQDVKSFPLLIGRQGAGLVIAGDDKLSRSHVRIAVEGQGFTITDLSANGTWVGEQRLEKDVPFAFAGPLTVRLGPNTTLELTPLA